MEFGVRGCCRGLQWAHCNVLRRLHLQEGIVPDRWESLEMRRGYSIYSFGLAAAGGKATEANMHDPYHNTKKQRADDDAQGAPTRRRQKKQKICISLEVMTQSEQPKKEENDRDEKKTRTLHIDKNLAYSIQNREKWSTRRRSRSCRLRIGRTRENGLWHVGMHKDYSPAVLPNSTERWRGPKSWRLTGTC